MSDVTPAARWRPTRAGIRNVWEYDDQVFEFADGRLILRGPNGSGKSNALALFVPFLLDGVMASWRMDSLGGGRSMKTLLLCLADDERANRFRHDQRTGYVWLEFERGGDHLTIGCGARASSQRDAEAWFFVTPRRPGVDLDLAPGGIPLSKGGLSDAVGAGAVHDSADAYRTAVDGALFGLGQHRYRNLLELLLVLRRPHLAGKLNLEHLSKVLSDGLAALDDDLIADVAASFEDLEAVQRDLQRLKHAHETVREFLPVYRRYLRTIARDRARAASDAARALRAATRRVTEAERAVQAADADVERVRLARLGCDERREVTTQRQRAVLESPAYRDATSLVEVEARVGDAERGLAEAETRLVSASDEAGAARGELSDSEREVARESTDVDLAFTAVTEAADGAGVAWTLRRDEVESPDLGSIVRGLAIRRRDDIAHVRKALVESERAAANAEAARSAAARAEEDAERGEDRRRAATEALEAARSALALELQAWVSDSGIAELASIVELASEVGEREAPSLTGAVARTLQPLRDELSERDVRARDLAKALSDDRSRLVGERERVASDPVPSPDRLATRPADRSGRAGAPLYACCDFAEGVPLDERACLEAAIEAAGLLDAWIGGPSDDLDAWLHPVQPAPRPTLADVLVPTPPAGSELDAASIHAVLASISLEDADIAVLPDGRFRLGPLSGRFAKLQPEFIGATAREQRRQRLLAELDDRIREVDAQLVALDEERSGVEVERRRLDHVVATLPSPAAVLVARDELVSAVAAARTAREAAARATSASSEARAMERAKTDWLRVVAGERRLPSVADGLDEADRLVHAYEQRASALEHAAGRFAGTRALRDRAGGRVARAERELAMRQAERDGLHRTVAGLRARVEQLHAQLGPDAQAPLRELAAIEGELRVLSEEAERLSDDASNAAERRGAAVNERATANEAVGRYEAAAARTSAALDVLRRPDVWSVAAGETSPPPDPFDLAAAVVAATADITAEADDNALQRAYRHLLDELGRGYDPSLSYVDHVAIVEVTSDAGTFSVVRLADELGSHVARQEELLSERDREIFERHLLTRVSESLRELLNDADDLVERVNESLAHRPTASGKSVHLRWELEAPDPAVRSALGLLRKTPDLLGPGEREELRKFFSTAITRRRAEDAAAGYAEILRHVLDYRSWHTFVPHVRSAGGGLQRLTRTLFRSLSGGEQAVVLHLPLFAAAAAHYDAGREESPRLIALDEAFAGIDEGMRGELMGLLVRFDLDLVLTGHELWGAYEQVPTLMVYDLLRQPPLEGVSAFAVRWDGAAMAEV